MTTLKKMIMVSLLPTLIAMGCAGCSIQIEPARGGQTLTISGGVSDQPHRIAAQQMENVMFSLADDFYFTDTALLNKLLTRDATVDVYYVSGAFVSIGSVFDKGFALPLTDERLIRDVEKMYACVAGAVMHDRGLYALPVGVDTEQCCMAYEPSLLGQCAEAGFKLPSSWMDLLRSIAEWDSSLWSQQISPIAMGRQELLTMSIQYYITSKELSNEPIVFDSAQFRQLIELALQAGTELAAHHSERMERSLFMRRSINLHTAQSNGYETLLLPLDNGLMPVAPISISLLFVNPYSKQPELAMDYLAKYFGALDELERMSLSPENSRPVKNPNTSELLATMRQSLSETKRQMENENDEQICLTLADTIAQYEINIEKLESSSWMVDEESINHYTQFMGNAVIIQTQLSQDENIRKLINRLEQGAISVQQFINELNRIWELSLQEQ